MKVDFLIYSKKKKLYHLFLLPVFYTLFEFFALKFMPFVCVCWKVNNENRNFCFLINWWCLEFEWNFRRNLSYSLRWPWWINRFIQLSSALRDFSFPFQNARYSDKSWNGLLHHPPFYQHLYDKNQINTNSLYFTVNWQSSNCCTEVKTSLKS